MTKFALKFLLIPLLLCSVISLSLSNPLAQNYSSEVLRLAKSAHIRALMNEEKPPCQNFYKYSCEKWPIYRPTSMTHQKTAYLDDLEDIFIQKSIVLLKEERRTDTKADKLLKTFFKSCQEHISKDSVGVEVFLDVADLKGGWPKSINKDWYEYDYDWLKVIAKLRSALGLNVIVGLEIVPDLEDKDLNRIMIGSPELPLGSRKHYLNEDFEKERETYKQSISSKLKKYLDNVSEQWLEEVSQQVLDLEKELANGLPENEELTIQQNTRQSYAGDLKAAYGNYVDITRYLNIIFNETIYMQILETPVDYLANVVEVIRKTPKLTIANYTAWRVIDHFDNDNAIEKPASEKQCVEQIIKYLPHHLENLFQRYSSYMSKINELQSTWTDIQRVFREDLQTPGKLAWMQTDTKVKAIQKLDAIELAIQTHDNSALEDYIKDLKMSSNKYYENLIELITLQSHINLHQIYEKPKKLVPEVKLPKYELTENKIRIPITFLQDRFFWDPAYPQAIKYGTLGVLLAQQMLHAFDSLGREYDRYGYHRPWWDYQSIAAFEEKAKCFNEQYQQYKYQNKPVNDINVVRTAIIDNGALNIAFRAYQKWFHNSIDPQLSTKEVLPHLPLSSNQLFFVSFAQVWCADYHSSISEFDIIPERLRVIGALANLNDFAIDFKCDEGNKMNPSQKCNIY